MITFSLKNINSFLTNSSQMSINQVKEDINLLKGFSKILEIKSIREIEGTNESYNILLLIKAYEAFIQTNDFQDFKCPKGKKDGTLHFHKFYRRNIIFYVGCYEICAEISLAVLKCVDCEAIDPKSQKYHALLPDFIFPYHIFSRVIILSTVYDRIVNKAKVQAIISKRNISHQLFYRWLKGFKKYSLSASTILGVGNKLDFIVVAIMKDIHSFLWNYYQIYYHPFFLFKNTCVPLAIIP